MSLRWLLTGLLVLIVVWFLIEGLTRRGKIYEFPFLAAVMTFSFILPQLPGLATDDFLPQGGYVKMVFMTILCILMVRVGWSSTSRPARMFRWTFSERKLLIAAALFSLFGCYFYLKLSHVPADHLVGVQISGVPVIYIFFARLLTYGLAIALICFVRRPSIAAAVLIGIDLLFYFDRIVITGKRAETAELVLIFGLAFWFRRRWAAPRSLAVAALVAGMVAMVGMTDYRQITRANDGPVWDKVAHIDVIGNFEELLKNGGPEVRNAILRINMTDATKQFDYGKFHWNRLVWDFFPSQIFGSAMKRSLMLPVPPLSRAYDPPTGSTETGMADAFASFWYFGCLKFFLLAYILKRIWCSAMRGDEAAQIVFALSIVPGMHAISHQTDWVVSVWVHMLIFLMPGLVFAITSTAKRGLSRQAPSVPVRSAAFAAPRAWSRSRGRPAVTA